MVYITNWQEFQEAAESLYQKSPRDTRYCVKWRATEGHLVLKITDNTACIKYKTHSSIFLNRFETLNLSLMRKMQNWKPASTPAEDHVTVASEGLPSASVPNISLSGGSGITGSSPAAGGVKKKKGKKKK
ncbi:signal recognition particle, SRP9/SRP14 subunit [Hysterangium stoloniferum]|nr:signal recognition particle, SRP9/SRP14 subunit [Hysterangium stoloniferum]